MTSRPRLDSFIQDLYAARIHLRGAATSYPVLHAASRALERVAHAVNRPFRIAILGESNAGKSTIANLIAGEMALPALPLANTRLPTLLHYWTVPRVQALHENGERFAPSMLDHSSLQKIVRLEVGLPSETLQHTEILDFPGSANPFFHTDVLSVLRHGIDAAIWTTVATQAWRETERLAWTGLPERIRRCSLLAVTHRDLVTREEDLRKLKARLQLVEREYFSAMCFVAASEPSAGSAVDLLTKLGRLREQFEAVRIEKAKSVTRRIAEKALAGLQSN